MPKEARGKNHQAYLWQYSRPGGAMVFDFRLGREREGPKRFLGNFEGILQSDGYAAYDHVGGPKILHAACRAHARRKFFQAVELNLQDQRAIGIVGQMDELFEIDEKAREEALSREDRLVLRLEKSKPLLDEVQNRGRARGCTAKERAGQSLRRLTRCSTHHQANPATETISDYPEDSNLNFVTIPPEHYSVLG